MLASITTTAVVKPHFATNDLQLHSGHGVTPKA